MSMKIPVHKTLELRFSLYTALIVIVFAIGISLWLLTSEKNEIISEHLRQLDFAGTQFSSSHAERLNDITLTAKALNRSIAARIASQDQVPPSLYKQGSIIRREDGAVRLNEGISGAFLAKSSPLTKDIERLYFFTKRTFQLIQPVVNAHFFNFYFISPDNFIRITPPKWAMTIDADHNFSEDLFYRIGTSKENPQREARWTEIYYDDIWQHWMTSIIIPVYLEDEFLGVTGCDIILDDFFERILEFSTSNKGMKAFLVDTQGNIIVHPEIEQPSRQTGDSMNAPYPARKHIDQVDRRVSENAIHNTSSPGTIHQLTHNNKRYYYVYYTIPSQQWYLCITIGEDTILGNFDRVIASVVFFSITLGLVLFLTLRYLVKTSILSRLNSLRTSIQQFTSGNLHTRVAITGTDEIGILEKGIQAMQTSMQEKIEELVQAQHKIQNSEARYRNYIDNAPDGIFITDQDGQYLEVNQRACEMSGYSKEELLSKAVPDLLASDMQDAGARHFKRVVTDGFASGTLAYITKKGERRYWTIDAVKLSETRMLGFVNDVTDMRKNEEELQQYRNQLEILVRERTAELEEKNQELERFNKLFIGREFRIKELRTKIHELTEQLSHYEQADTE
jgi:PAS domain S-box-containing protein